METSFPGKPVYDDGSWHGSFQDLRAEVRFKATTGSLAVTPLLALVVPTSGYGQLAHSAHGRHLVEGQLGVNAGRFSPSQILKKKKGPRTTS